MIDIRTETGIFLDLSPDYEFAFEVESPIFDTDGIPAAFSTSISFPNTEKNRRIFGYLGAMMLPPTVHRVECTLFFNGVPLVEGTLLYEGIEDSELQYTFTARSIDSRFEQKISDIPITAGGIYYHSLEQLLSDVRNDVFEGIHAPVIVNQEKTEESDSLEVVQDKYFNYPNDIHGTRKTLPVINILRILRPGSVLVRLSNAVASKAEHLVIVGQYRLSADKESDTVFTRMGGEIDFATYLPGITFMDVLKLLNGLFAARIFQDGRNFLLIGIQEVLQGDIIDIDNKVSDAFSSSEEKGKKYTVGYSGSISNTYNIKNLDTDIVDGDMYEATGDLAAFVASGPSHGSSTGYKSARHAGGGQCYSYKMYSTWAWGYREMLIDNIYRPHTEFTSGTAEDEESVRIGASPVKCVPKVIPIPTRNADGAITGYNGDVVQVTDCRITPVISIPDKAERGTDVLLGVYGYGQVSDNGLLFIDPDDHTDVDIPDGVNLSPEALFNDHHSDYAAWVSKDRQVVTVGLDLSAADISSWRMYRRFAFRGRLWICRKLTVNFNTSSEAIEAEGEFVEV